MHKLFCIAGLIAWALLPCAAPAQSAMSGPALGVGPHGSDYFLGNWTCTNSAASAVSGPTTSKLSIVSSSAGAPLFFRVTAPGFDESGYVSYSAKTRVWSNPTSYADGSYGFESTKQVGRKTTWTGTYFNAASGTTVAQRDTYTLSTGRYTDVNQTKVGGVWKTTGSTTCTKS